MDLSQANETRIGEIHLDVPVPGHEGLNGHGLLVQPERRAHEVSLHQLQDADRSPGAPPQEIGGLREDRLAGQQRRREPRENVQGPGMMLLVAVDERHDRTGIDEYYPQRP